MVQSRYRPPQSQADDYIHIGAYFRDVREHYRLDIHQVSERLHIRTKYIEAIETGDMKALPGKVYTQGYIQNYAEFLGLDAHQMLERYRGLDDKERLTPLTIANPNEQSGTPAWRMVVIAIALLFTGYVIWEQFYRQPIHSASGIEPVPQRIQDKANNALSLTSANQNCLKLQASSSWQPCYYTPDDTQIVSAFVLSPIRTVMELQP